jgi:Xaa-Pro aminopeptidase
MPTKESPKKNAIKKVRSKVSRIGIDAMLVTGRSDVIYLADLYAPGMLLVTKTGTSAYFVDPMNRTLAEEALKGLGLEIVTVKGSIAETIAFFIRGRKIRKIGYAAENLSVSDYSSLSRRMPKVKFLLEVQKFPLGSILGDLRKIKGAEEAGIIRKAAKATTRVWRQVKKEIKPGMSELQIATLIDVRVRTLGYGNSFPTIAATGKNTAYPHAVPMGRRLKKGEHLLVDFGIRYKGYCSDLTRVWADGRIGRKIGLLRKHVRVVQDKVIKKLKPGVSIGALVKEVNTYFKKNNFGGYICHGLGHGVGLDIHEAPFLQEASKERLKEGMVLTIEPGLYIPKVGGVRVEDMALITRNGCEVLTQ